MNLGRWAYNLLSHMGQKVATLDTGFMIPRRIKPLDVKALRVPVARRRCGGELQPFNFRCSISPTSAGFALPLLSFITCPLRKFSAAVLPDL